MDVNRRNLRNGVLTGSTLLALGIPPAAVAGAATGTPGTSGRVRLLLGSDISDAEFAAGARTAFAANARHAPAHTGVAAGSGAKTGHGALEVVKLKGGLLNEYEKVANLLETFRGTRWIAVMDDGSAAVFTELVRNAGGSMVLLGSHVASAGAITPNSQHVPGLRHVWAAASPAHAPGSILATRLAGGPRGFSIVENFFSTQAAADSARTDGFLPGFLAWRRDGTAFNLELELDPDPTYLYCAGVSPAAGCELLGWNGAFAWTPVHQESPPESAGFGKNGNKTGSKPEGMQPQAGAVAWVEAVGYAVMAAALGAGAFHQPCSTRAHVHQPGAGKSGLTGGAARFTSFVVDL
jgi:hypothetical protein